jgi:hypothetical protein
MIREGPPGRLILIPDSGDESTYQFGFFVGAKGPQIPPQQEGIGQAVFYPCIGDRIDE